MSSSLTLYTPIRIPELQKLMEAYQIEFDQLLEDTFTEEELAYFERQIDAIAAVFVQPILSELSFDDFYPDPGQEQAQRFFFEECRSSVLLENLPFLETNPFQVTWLVELLKKFSEVLIDTGGVSELSFKEKYLTDLSSYKTIDHYTASSQEKKVEVKSNRPIDPIDFLVADVYKEFARLQGQEIPIVDLSAKVKKIYDVMSTSHLDSLTILRRSGLNAKDFDDGLERLKFYLRKF